jgi:hypothetical protein
MEVRKLNSPKTVTDRQTCRTSDSFICISSVGRRKKPLICMNEYFYSRKENKLFLGVPRILWGSWVPRVWKLPREIFTILPYLDEMGAMVGNRIKTNNQTRTFVYASMFVWFVCSFGVRSRRGLYYVDNMYDMVSIHDSCICQGTAESRGASSPNHFMRFVAMMEVG